MKLILLRLFKMTMKFSTYGFLFHVFFMSMLMASSGKAQYKKTNEIFIKEAVTGNTVKEVFKLIEENSDFEIFFVQRDIKSKKDIQLKPESGCSVYDILIEVSKQTGLKFRQVNNVISATPISTEELNGDIKRIEVLADVDISGQITDENGEGLPGASVIEKGTSNGTTTDLEGNYKLALPEESVLVVSFVGYSTQDVVLAGRSKIDIKMELDASQLDEIVVVGYGTAKIKNLTGSVKKITTEDIVNKPIVNAEQALSGRIAGVNITANTGKPGLEGAEIRIRGIGTLNNSSPLILVDGLQSSMRDVPPSDIATITVLKDAAAAAIYGARAANGVILITTKRGKPDGKLTLKYSSYAGVQKATNIIQTLDSWDFAELANESRTNGDLDPQWSQEQIQGFRNGTDANLYPNTDWLALLYRTAQIQNHNLSISGGDEKVQYNISTGYLNQDGIQIGSNFERYNFRSNFDAKINNAIKIGMNLYGSQGSETSSFGQPSSGNASNNEAVPKAMRTALRIAPTIPIYNLDGDWGMGKNSRPGELNTLGNPIAQASIYDAENVRNKFLGKFFAEVTFLKDFKFKTSYGYQWQSVNGTHFEPTIQFRDGETGTAIRGIPINRLRENTNINKLTTFENTLTFNKVFDDVHAVKVLVGTSKQQSRTDSNALQRADFPNNDLREIAAGSSEFDQLRGTASEWAFLSYFGRINYGFDERYLIEANVRYDGSSRFGSSNRYGIFPSFSAGWRLSNESFMSEVTIIKDLKLRGSWGQLGNSEIGNYGFTPAVGFSANYSFNGTVAAGAAPTAIANPDIKWETVTMSNIGVDFNLFDRKLAVTADYFNKITDDILVRIPIPATFGGLSAPFQNAGKVQNKGIELSLDYADNIGDVDYSVYANGSHITNEVLELKDQEISHDGGRFVTRVGLPFQSVQGYVVEGIFQTQDEVDNHATQSATTGPGDLKYKDVNEDGVINAAGDRTIIGNTVPKWTFGFGANASYKGFDFNIHFQGVKDRDMILDTWGRQSTIGRGNTTVNWLDRWTPENTNTDVPRLGFGHNHANSEFWMEDGSYLRLKNLEIGYALSDEICKKISIQKLRLYVSGTNLITMTDYTGWDPEKSGPWSRSDEYPPAKVMTLGLNLTF